MRLRERGKSSQVLEVQYGRKQVHLPDKGIAFKFAVAAQVPRDRALMTTDHHGDLIGYVRLSSKRISGIFVHGQAAYSLFVCFF